MTPSELGWMQGSVFYILGTVLTPGVVWLCVRKYRTKHGEREVELEGIQIGTDTGTHSFEGEPPSERISLLRGGDDEGIRRPPSNDAPEAIVFTALPCRSFERKPSSPGRKRLRRSTTLKPPSVKKSRGMDVVPQTESRMLRRRERGSDGADPATPWVSSTTTAGGLPRPPRRRFVPESLPQDERIPQVDHIIQAETFLQGLRYRPSTAQGQFFSLSPVGYLL